MSDTAEIDGLAAELAPLVGRHRPLLIGDIAGTNELPALMLAIVNRALEHHDELIIGLEIPMTEPVDGSGRGSFFSRPDSLCDGRSSIAMAGLIDALAALDGARTVALDGPWVGPGAPVPMEHFHLLGQPRDSVMAGRLLAEIDLVPQVPVIVLADTMHITVDRDGGTLGGLIAPWFPELRSLASFAAGGEAWTLTTEGCGPMAVIAQTGVPVGAQWVDTRGADGFNGYLNIGSITPSPPPS